MAVFGFHLVLTMIAATVFSKLKTRFSFCESFVFRGLFYYVPPETRRLKEIAEQNAYKTKKRRNKADENEPFNIPRNADVELLRVPMQSKALEGLPFLSTLIWTVDYLVFAVAVYLISEGFLCFFPENKDTNTSLIWLLCALAFLLQSLVRLTASKLFTSELYAERNLIISFAAIFFLLSMLFTMFSERYIDVGFTDGYHRFSRTLIDYLRTQEIGEYAVNLQVRSPLMLFVGLSVMFSFVAAMLLFPNLRYASMYLDATREASVPTRVLLHTTFVLPLLTLTLFTKPVKEHLLDGLKDYITEEKFDFLRLALVIIWVLLRLFTTKVHLQAYLDLPLHKVEKMKTEGGYIKSTDFVKLVYQYASYFCVASLQYFVAPLLTAVLCFLLKSLGHIRLLDERSPVINSPPDSVPQSPLHIFLDPSLQRPFWTLCLVAVLGMNAFLSAFGVLSTTSFLQ
ncbi:Protein Y87G2A.13 [Aphelenchoides avenae]|nr:Protein Y87G2A.13 [Aphelenchus avenae]